MINELESDEYCPYCDNKYVLDAVTKENKWVKINEGMRLIWIFYWFTIDLLGEKDIFVSKVQK